MNTAKRRIDSDVWLSGIPLIFTERVINETHYVHLAPIS